MSIDKYRLLKSFILSTVVATVITGCGTATSTRRSDDVQRDYTATQIEHSRPLVPGDRFRFDNPDMVWTVVANEDDKVVWENNIGAQQVTTANPLLPAISWSSDEGTGKRLISNMNGSFFPMEVGAQVQFKSTVSTNTPPYSWEFDWNCLVAGETRVNLPIGPFDTFRVECSRQQPEVWTFYYAPRLGYYVMMEQVGRAGGAPVRRILTGYDKEGYVVGDLTKRKDQTGSEEADNKQMDTAITATPVETQKAENAPAPMMMDRGTADTEVSQPEMMQKADAPKPSSGEDIMALTPDNGQVTAAKQMPAKEPAKIETSVGATSTIPAGFYIRVASYKNAKNVDRGWDIFKSRYPDQFAGLNPYTTSVDIAGQGQFTRLMGGPIATKADANARCKKLKSQGQYCVVYEQK